ncbi:response regulator [Haloprofundus salinisoli]|uniref:response regulator n=1 Tax=Haloprofundus salinisoli TaxID=2876193 RepID=UPI001CCD4898|nr:response regulator [Haloprofundus salinisoli]
MSNKSTEPVEVLLVEDNPDDIRLTQEAFEESGIRDELHVVHDGEQALDFLYQRGQYENAPVPRLILLDLNLPSLDGEAVLREIKDTPSLRQIPTIVLTSSEAEEDIARSYDLHANAYLVKPVDPDDFIGLARAFEEFWLQLARLPSPNYN